MSSQHDTDLAQRLEKALVELPRLQREIFHAVRVDDMSYQEIADRTGLTVGRVERHFARALYKLDKQLRGGRLRWWERWF